MNRGIVGLPRAAEVALGNFGGEERLAKMSVNGRVILDPQSGNGFDLTLVVNTTFEFGRCDPGRLCSLFVIVRQDGTGSRTLTWPSATYVKWHGGAAPTASTAANSVDAYSFFTTDGGVTWLGAQVGKGYA